MCHDTNDPVSKTKISPDVSDETCVEAELSLSSKEEEAVANPDD